MIGGEIMRLFAAIDLSDEIKDALVSVQNEMRRSRVNGNYTKRENFHVTLAFIGEWSDPENVVGALGAVTSKPFDIRLDRLGAFDSLWWAGIDGSEPLMTLSRRVRRALADGMITYDSKRFSPHITLVRRPDAIALPDVYVPKIGMRVDSFSLFRSDRTKSGMVYTLFAGFDL